VFHGLASSAVWRLADQGVRPNGLNQAEVAFPQPRFRLFLVPAAIYGVTAEFEGELREEEE